MNMPGAQGDDILEDRLVSNPLNNVVPLQTDIFNTVVPLLGLASELKEEAEGPSSAARTSYTPPDFNLHSWEEEALREEGAVLFARLPDDATLQSLLALYFRHVSPFWPIVHKPTLEVQCADLLHQRYPSQARLVLMVCAIASIYWPDFPGAEGRPPGWEYFSCVRSLQKDFLLAGPTNLIDVQVIAVCCPRKAHVTFTDSDDLFSCRLCITSWRVRLILLGLLLVQASGSPRKLALMKLPLPMGNDPWRRRCGNGSFGVYAKHGCGRILTPKFCVPYRFLISMDRSICAMLGHSELIHEETYVAQPVLYPSVRM